MKEIGSYENKKHGSRSVAYLDLWIFIGGQCGGNSDCAADRGKSACVYKDKTELAGAFDGMAPGDSRTVVIKIENQNSHKASFLFRRRQRMLWKKQEKRLAEHMSFRWRSAMIPEGYLCWMQMPVDMRKMWQVPKV